MEDRKSIILGQSLEKTIEFIEDEKIDDKYSAQIISSIIAEGDVIGSNSFFIFSKANGIIIYNT